MNAIASSRLAGPTAGSTGTPADGPSRGFRFGDTEIDLARREVRRAGLVVEVQPRVFDLIVHLVRHRDRVVGREELLDEVWGTRFVATSTVNGRIRAARSVLDDTGEEQRVIRTLHGRGYRFVADVTDLDAPVDTPALSRADARAAAPARSTPTEPVPEPVGKVAVTAASVPCPPPDALVHDWPLVGRVDVLDEIETVYADGAADGVLLDGVDGVGTSRTATAAAERLAARGAHVVTVRGLEGAADLPLSAMAHLIDPTVLDTRHTADDLARADVMHRAVSILSSVAAAGARLVVVVDEAHHLDPLSTAVVASLVQSRRAFAVVAARRTAAAAAGSAFDGLVHMGALRHVPVQPLSPIHVDVLLYRALRGAIDATSLQAFTSASGGRPGHLRDLVDGARASGSLRFEGGVWRLVGPLPPRVALTWPHPAISDAATRAAEIIALAGEIGLDLLAELCDDEAIDELDAERLLTVTDVGGEPGVALVDPALSEVVVASIGGLRQQRLRRRIAGRLLESAADDASALATVIDFTEGTDVGLHVDRTRACDVARRTLVAGQTDRALRLVDRMARWEEPDAIVLRAEAAALRSQWELADELLSCTDANRLEPPWITAAVTLGADLDFFQHARHEQAITRLTRHTDDDDDAIGRITARRLWLLAERGAADSLATALAAAGGRPGATPDRVLAGAVSSLLAGRFSDALTRADELGSDAVLSPRQTDAALSVRCAALHELGRLDEARELARIALQRDLSGGLGVLPIVAAELELDAGAPRAARVLLGNLADSGHARRHPYLTPVVAGTAGVVELVLGHRDAAHRLFDIAERDLGRAPTRLAWMLRVAIADAVGAEEAAVTSRHAGLVIDHARALGAALPEARALRSLLAAGIGSWDGADVARRLAEITRPFEGESWRTVTPIG